MYHPMIYKILRPLIVGSFYTDINMSQCLMECPSIRLDPPLKDYQTFYASYKPPNIANLDWSWLFGQPCFSYNSSISWGLINTSLTLHSGPNIQVHLLKKKLEILHTCTELWISFCSICIQNKEKLELMSSLCIHAYSYVSWLAQPPALRYNKRSWFLVSHWKPTVSWFLIVVSTTPVWINSNVKLLCNYFRKDDLCAQCGPNSGLCLDQNCATDIKSCTLANTTNPSMCMTRVWSQSNKSYHIQNEVSICNSIWLQSWW